MADGQEENATAYDRGQLQKVAIAVGNLTDIAEGVQKDLRDSLGISSRLIERVGQLETLMQTFNRLLVLGNGQPPVMHQLVELRTRFDQLTSSVKELNANHSIRQLADLEARFENLEKNLSALVAERKDEATQRGLSRTQYIVAMLGIVAAVLGSLVALFGAYVK